MKFIETPIAGAFVIDIEPVGDERGLFSRLWCREEFAARGLETHIEQCNVSFNVRRGTFRGIHYQAAPYEETKIMRCTRGALYDAILDLRRDSPTRGQWFGIELTAENRRMLYIPRGVANGYITLKDNTEIYYQISHAYVADAQRGVRWNDPAFDIAWPAAVEVISERDRNFPDYDERDHGG